MNGILGQTGRQGLSDTAIDHKIAEKRTVRYQFTKVQHGWNAWVCAPFHSRTYGAVGFGTTKEKARKALRARLADNYGYCGHIMFSDVDAADNVGEVDIRLWDDRADNRPISLREACGAAGV